MAAMLTARAIAMSACGPSTFAASAPNGPDRSEADVAEVASRFALRVLGNLLSFEPIAPLGVGDDPSAIPGSQSRDTNIPTQVPRQNHRQPCAAANLASTL